VSGGDGRWRLADPDIEGMAWNSPAMARVASRSADQGDSRLAEIRHLGRVAMPRFGIPRREFDEKGTKDAPPVNWRRGLLRVWLLVSAAWVMGWLVYLILYGIQGGFQSSAELLALPVLLFGPPVALLLFGLLAGWAFRGFKPE
jgi:hypothetical protein